MLTRAWLILSLAAVLWTLPPMAPVGAPGWDQAAWAKSGSNSGSGGSNSGSGSSGSDDDDDDDHSGSGSSGPGGGGTAQGQPGSVPRRAAGSAGSNSLFLGGGGIHVQYADGHIERIRDSVFEALDGRGRLVERHSATRQEEQRLKALETTLTREGRNSGLLVVAEIDERAERAEITDFRGWRERMSGGRYLLSDPDGRTVTRRSLMAVDIARLRAMLFLD